MKTRYELALDAAAVQMRYAEFMEVIAFDGNYNAIHTRAAEIFAMGFAEWKDDNQFTRYNNEWTSTKAYYAGCVYTTQELLTLYNNA